MSDYPSIVHTSLRSIDSLPVRMTTPDILDLEKGAAHIARASDRATRMMFRQRHILGFVRVGRSDLTARPLGY